MLEKAGLTLFHINESTLLRWYKNTSRVQEVRTLLQGLLLPTLPPCTAECLPEACIQPSKPSPPPQDPHIFTDVEDTSGQGRVRGNTATMGSGYSTTTDPYLGTASVGTSTPTTSAVAPSTTTTPQSPDAPAAGTEMDVTKTALRIPKTTAWRHKKTGTKNEQRKVYTCKKCGQPMASGGHTQFRGNRYCPNVPGQIPREQWLAARREEAMAKAAAKQQ